MTAASDNPAKAPVLCATPAISIRPEVPDDSRWIDKLHAIAFGPGRYSRAAFRVRERFAIDPTLSLVAEIDGHPVSSVWMTPISLTGRNGYLLGPLATDPAFRAKGSGRKLVLEVCKIALKRGEGDYVLLVGDEPYYGPLGFMRTRPNAIRFPGPVDPNRILVHSADSSLAETLEGDIAAFNPR